MSYTQLSTVERFELHRLRTTTDLSLRKIARLMGRAQSTLSRELQRNRLEGDVYLPDTAQQRMQYRRLQSKRAFMSVSDNCLEQIKRRLEKYHSPESDCGSNETGGD